MRAEDFFADVAPKKTKTKSVDEFFADVTPKKIESKTTEQPESDYSRYAGLAGRAVLEGVAGIPGGIYNLTSTVGNIAPNLASAVTGKPRFESITPESINTQKYGTQLADYFGLPQPTESEQVPMQFGRMAAGSLGGAGLLKTLGAAPSILKTVGAEMPFRTAISSGTGSAAGEYAKQQELPLWQQLAANSAGGFGSSAVMNMTAPIGRTIVRGGQAITNQLEPVAGRLLNRQAGEEADIVQRLLEGGQVPGLRPIEGFMPRTSDIAGNAGISGLARFVENSNVAPTSLANRVFDNAKSLKDYINKAVGSDASIAKKEEFASGLANNVLKPMRERNLPVETSNVIASIEQSLARHKGNPTVEAALQAIRNKMPEKSFSYNYSTGAKNAENVGFNEVYNFKQYIDEALRGKYSDDDSLAIQKAGKALEAVRKELAKALTDAEPETAKYLKSQAIAMRQLNQAEAAEKLIKEKSLTGRLTSDKTGAREEVYPLSAAGLTKALRNEKTLKELSPNQIAIIQNAQKAAVASQEMTRGMAKGSPTFQNMTLDKLIGDDIARGLSGTDMPNKAGLLSGIVKPITKSVSNALGRTEDLAQILARAELDPKYAAELMRKYKLSGPIDLSTPAGRAALYGALQQYRQQ